MCRGTPCRACPRLRTNSSASPIKADVANLAHVLARDHRCDSTLSTSPSTPSSSSGSSSTKNTTLNAKRRASFLARSLATRTVSFVESQVERLTCECNFIKHEQPNAQIAELDRSEVLLGELLGQGGFSQVHSVACIRLDNNDNSNEYDFNLQQLQVRALLQESANSGCARYVLKHLRPDLCSSPSIQHRQQQRSAFHAAAADLVLEAQFLSRMGDHPNIIKLRGWAAGGTSCFGKGLHDAYFLLLDRLDETLTHRIIEWRKEQEVASAVAASNLQNDDDDDDQANIYRYAEKLDLTIQLGSALEYLHEKRIVYRDLKADNVGLINNGTTVQLFDFGLARELPPSRIGQARTEKHHQESELFQMSGVGTRRYCAPEVVLGGGYNLQVDIYSMTIVLYEMMSHKKPFGVMGPESHRVLVAEGGQRPVILHAWPVSLQTLLRCGWAAKPQDRPTINDFCQDLQKLKDECCYECISEHQKTGEHSRNNDCDWCHCSLDVLPNLIRNCSGREGCG
jgi:serine/threonine protein kinase